MAQSKTSRYIGILCLLALLMLLYGCGHNAVNGGPTIKVKSQTELDIEAMRDDLLKRCEGLSPDLPENSTGALLDDGTEAMNKLAQCMARQGQLVDYLKPIVDRERARKP